MEMFKRALVGAMLLTALYAQPTWLTSAFVPIDQLPVDIRAVSQKMGGRLTGPENATVTLGGSLSDASGVRAATITVSAPGFLLLRDGTRAIAYDGTTWQIKNGAGGQADTQAQESLLAHLPETFLLQLVNGGSARRIGGRFRTDDGKASKYTGPYWTLYGFTPKARIGLSVGQALQQGYFVAIDEQTALISEVRVIVKGATLKLTHVTQTKFNKWFQQGGQWYPGEIVRLEDGLQVLKLTVQQAATG